MALPANWPPKVSSGLRSIRAYVTATSTVNFSDNAYMFADLVAGTANTFTPTPVVSPSQQTMTGPSGEGTNANTALGKTPNGTGANDANDQKPQTWAFGIRICNDGTTTDKIDYSFDAVNVHGQLKAGETVVYLHRHESGIAIRASSGTPSFRIEAW